MKQKTFFRGAIILSIAGITSKVLGAVYRIPFARLVGDEGVGLYQMAYPFYTLILAVSTAGIPLAISKLVAERDYSRDEVGIKKVFWLSMSLLLIIGALFFLGLFFSADFIASNILNEPRAALSLKAIAPAILFTSVMATLRGYFQGFQRMVPTALSQVFEQVIRVSTVFWAAFYLMPLGVEYVAAGATFGAASGGFAGLLLLIIIFIWTEKKRNRQGILIANTGKAETNGEIIKQIIYLAVPISIGGLVLPLMQTMDTFIVPARLQAAGFTSVEATSLYGQLSGMAGAIINLPFIITTAIAASLVPAVADAVVAGRKLAVKEQFSSAMLLAIIIVLPASVGLLVLATPICQLLYAEPAAGIPLAWLAPAVLIVGVYQISTGVLQGLGKPFIPVVSLFWGALLKGVLTFSLTAISGLGIRGAALGTVIGFMVAAIRNLFIVSKIVGFEWFRFKDHLLKPTIAVVIMGSVVLGSYSLLLDLGLGQEMTTLLAILLGAIIYFLVLLFIGGIKTQDIRKVPKIGEKLASILEKIRLAR